MRLLVTGIVLATALSAAGGAARRPVPRLDHVVVVVFENREARDVLGTSQAPTFNALARHYALLENYTAVAHPSLPNYLALVSGSTHGIKSDCTTCTVAAPSLADTLGHARLGWKTYAEGLPLAGFRGASAGRYAKRHDPFLYFDGVAARPALRRRIVPLSEFTRDLRTRLPAFSLVVPDLCHDMHDCSVRTGDRWLAGFLRPLLRSSQLRNGVVFVVFDEGTSGNGGGGHVLALALGPRVRTGARFSPSTSHYGLLRTIEDALGLPPLAKSGNARPITGIWK